MIKLYQKAGRAFPISLLCYEEAGKYHVALA